MRGIAILWILSAALLSIRPVHAQSIHTGNHPGPEVSQWAFDRVANAHCVVECTIVGEHSKLIRLRDYISVGGETSGSVVVAELSKVVVVRGYGSPDAVVLDARDSGRFIGQRVLLCCYWIPGIKMFAAPSRDCIFHRNFGRWVETRHAGGFPPEERASINPADLARILEENALPALTRSADLIVVAHVESVADSFISLAAPYQYRAQRLEVKLNRVLKGRVDAQSLSVLTGEVPRTFKPGETWLMFLRAGDQLHTPVGGNNGSFRFSGQRVYYDRNVRCPYQRNALVERVRRLVAIDRREKSQATRRKN